jgi:hypothetical protein
MQDIFEQLMSEFDLNVASETLVHDGKEFKMKKVYMVNVRTEEKQFLDFEYQSDVGKKESLSRLDGIKPALNALCEMLEKDSSSMNICVTTDDDRLISIHIILDKLKSEMMISTYTTYSSTTDQYQNDLAMYRDMKKYIQRKTDLYEYIIKSIDMFGCVYHIQKIGEKVQREQT